MESGGQPGNDNAKSGTEWRSSIKRALTRFASASGDKEPTYRKGIDKIADELVKAAANGDRWAIEEIGNRADGKPAQSVTVSGDEDNPLFPTQVNVNVVTPEKRIDPTDD